MLYMDIYVLLKSGIFSDHIRSENPQQHRINDPGTVLPQR